MTLPPINDDFSWDPDGYGPPEALRNMTPRKHRSMTLPPINDDFSDMGLSPELTEAMRDLSTVNVGIIQLKQIMAAGAYSPDIPILLSKLENGLMPLLVDRINYYIKREQILKKGLTGDEEIS